MKLFHRRLGQGQTVIIAHGLYGSSDNWMTIANALSTQFEVILVDMRNHGQSPHSPEHSYPDLASDLLELINEFHLVNPAIIGHSMGGKAAMQLALDHPDKIAKLVVVDIAPTSYITGENYAPQAQEHVKIISALQSLPLQQITSRIEAEQLLSKSVQPMAVVRFLLKNMERNDLGGFYWKLNLAALDHNLGNLMGGVHPTGHHTAPADMPTLFIKGELSPYINIERDKEVIASLFPQSHITTIPKAGHWVHAEQTSKFLEKLNDFLLRG